MGSGAGGMPGHRRSSCRTVCLAGARPHQQKPPYFRGSTGAFVAWLRPVNYRCLTYSNPLGAFMSLKSVGSQSGSMRGPDGQRPSCMYSEEAMEFSQIQL